MNLKNRTDKQEEIDNFSKLASEWWDPNGKFAPLHKFNPIRQEYLVHKIKNAAKNLNKIIAKCIKNILN